MFGASYKTKNKRINVMTESTNPSLLRRKAVTAATVLTAVGVGGAGVIAAGGGESSPAPENPTEQMIISVEPGADKSLEPASTAEQTPQTPTTTPETTTTAVAPETPAAPGEVKLAEGGAVEERQPDGTPGDVVIRPEADSPSDNPVHTETGGPYAPPVHVEDGGNVPDANTLQPGQAVVGEGSAITNTATLPPAAG